MTVPGGSPLNYPPGSQPAIQRISRSRAPTSNDSKNVREGDEWLDTSSDDWYKLADITGITATWVKIGGTAGASEEFLPDSGTSPVVPSATNQVTMAGGTNIGTVGGTNSLTFNLDDPFSVGAATITTLGSTTVNTTTLDTNVAAAAVTLSGTTLAADGTDANIDIEITPKGNGVLLTAALGNAADVTAIAMTAAGEVTMPLQPAFMANVASDIENVTGNGTLYILGDTDVGAALNERFDQGGDFVAGSAAGAIFTAPVTGRYQFNFLWIAIGTTIATTFESDIVASNFQQSYTYSRAAAATDQSTGYSVMVDMDASDTCLCHITVSGEAGDTVDIGNTHTTFSGWLVV